MVYINENGQTRLGWRVPTDLQSATYLLDSYGGAAAAYSLRKLNSTYVGSAIRVRRSGDNSEQNIGFDAGGNLDTASLLSFIGVNNIALYSEEFDNNSYWHKNDSSIVANQTTAPDGTMTADLFREGTSQWNHSLGKLGPTSYLSGTSYNASVYLKKGTGSQAPNTIALGFGETNTSTMPYVIFNISTGVVVASDNATGDSDFGSSITDAGNGWWRCSMWGTITGTLSRTQLVYVRFVNNLNTLPSPVQYTGNVNRDIYIWGYQYVNSVNDTSALTLKEYRKTSAVSGGNGYVTTWYDQSSSYNAVQTTSTKQPQIVSAGVLLTQNNKPTIKFDGVDDFFVTGTYSFTSTDKLYGAYVSTTELANASAMIVGQYRQTNTQAVYILGYSNTANTWITTRNSLGTIAITYLHGSYVINTQYLAEAQFDLLNTKSVLKIKTWRNNIAEPMTTNGGTSTALPNISMPISIGADVIGTTWKFKGNMQEIVLYYNADKTSERASIATNINNYYNIYTPTPAPNLTTGLFGIWNGNGNTNDTYGTLNGSATGGLTYSVGKNGNAFTFNNSSTTMVSFPINSWTTGDNFSFSLWFNVTSLTSASQALISNYGYTNSPVSYFGWGLRVSTGGLTFQRLVGTGAVEEFSSGTVTANQWHHVVVTRNGSVTKVYLNGDLVGGKYSNTATAYSNTVPRIGLRMDTDTTNAVWPMTNGSKIDEVYLWTRAITDDEAKLLYNSGNGQYYPF